MGKPESVPTVLVVDDETAFLRFVADGFAAFEDTEIVTAANGVEALRVLDSRPVDLVVTDLKMPGMDGFELLAAMSQKHRSIPVIVMSAFGTPEIELTLKGQGVSRFLDKPLDIQKLRGAISEALASLATGRISGISLSTFLQMIQLDQKTCTVRVVSNAGRGELRFLGGQVVQAEAGSLSGEEAALAIFSWDEPVIELVGSGPSGPKQALPPLSALLLESFKRKDEQALRATPETGGPAMALQPEDLEFPGPEGIPVLPTEPTPSNKENHMAAIEKLKELAAVDGFAGAALFTPTGESLVMYGAEGVNLKDIGVLANNVLMNAQKASLDMGTGRGQQVHVEAEHAHILVRCLNEGTDPLRSQPGKAHIHLVMILKSDASIGMAKLKINSVINKLGEEFRG
ncbi:MAG: response regulator [Acidobacteria bacterium]|nr:response regulator [Acidobacteriota bacterium]